MAIDASDQLPAPLSEPVIDTREELVIALTEASELEHGLLVQYLFAAYSMKKRASEGLSEAQIEKVRGWERAILEVAREEMAHLGTVCNMLTAVGGSSRLGRPNFPQGREGSFRGLRESYYPFDFQLEPFGESSLDRFVAFEKPADVKATEAEALVAPDPLEFDRLGELYRQIADAFRRLDENYRRRGERLFIGPPEAQDRTDWSANGRAPTTRPFSASRLNSGRSCGLRRSLSPRVRWPRPRSPARTATRARARTRCWRRALRRVRRQSSSTPSTRPCC